MPLPGDLTTIIVTGTYPGGDGNALTGKVTFTPSADLTDTTGHVIVRAAPIIAPLYAGSLKVVLLCTDSADISPTGWYWIVAESIDGAPARTYNVLIPHSGSTVDLSTLAPVSPGPAVSTLYGVLAAGNTNTWLSNQVFSGPIKIPTGAANNDVLTSDASGNASWQPAGSQSGVQVGGDIGGTNTNPTVITTHLTNPLPVAQGGTGSATENFVDLTTNQSVGGIKTFTGEVIVPNGSAASDAAALGQVPIVGAAGSGAGHALSANDATTTNARTPTAHASTHASGGSDPVTPDSIGALSAGWEQMLGLGLLTAPFSSSAVTYAQTAGDLVFCLCTPSRTKSISTLGVWVTAAGVTGSGVNALMLFAENGTLIDQTGDMTSAFSSTGAAEGAMGGSHTVTAGVNYYLGVLTHFSGTTPHLAATGTTQTANFPVVGGHYTAIFKSAQASVPASFTPSSYTANSGYYIVWGR